MKLLISTAFHQEMDHLSVNSNQTVLGDLFRFTTQAQASWDDYFTFSEDTYNFSVARSTKQMPFELDLSDEPPLVVDLVADLQWPKPNQC
jgi:hypothetical protein